MPEQYITKTQVLQQLEARGLKTSERTLNRWIAAGLITILKLGGKVKILPSTIDAFIDGQISKSDVDIRKEVA